MAKEEVNKSLAKPLAIIAATLGILQGLSWTIFGILCICCYYGAIENTPDLNTWYYYDYIYELFLRKVDVTGNSDIILTSNEFSIFMWIYIVLGPAWIITSTYMLMGMISNQWQRSKLAFGGWSFITLMISIVDIVFVGLLASDYKYVDDNLQLLTNQETILVVYGIVMSVAARGYLLWLINVIFALIIIKFTRDIVKYQNSGPRIPIIYGYDTTSIRPPWATDSKDLWSSGNQTPHYANDAFVDDSRSFERSHSFFPPEPDNRISFQSRNTNPYPPPVGFVNDYSKGNGKYSPPNANKVAKIGKPTINMRSNNNVYNGPIIPEPDYTPPGTPTGLKSVLRSRSIY